MSVRRRLNLDRARSHRRLGPYAHVVNRRLAVARRYVILGRLAHFIPRVGKGDCPDLAAHQFMLPTAARFAKVQPDRRRHASAEFRAHDELVAARHLRIARIDPLDARARDRRDVAGRKKKARERIVEMPGLSQRPRAQDQHGGSQGDRDALEQFDVQDLGPIHLRKGVAHFREERGTHGGILRQFAVEHHGIDQLVASAGGGAFQPPGHARLGDGWTRGAPGHDGTGNQRRQKQQQPRPARDLA